MAQPVTVAEAKLFLRVEHEAEDGLIQTLIEAAQAKVEGDEGADHLAEREDGGCDGRRQRRAVARAAGGGGRKVGGGVGQGIFRDAASDALVREAFFDQAASGVGRV